MSKKKEIPSFKSEDEEFEFWSKTDAMDYFDDDKAFTGIFPNLKPTSEKISIDIPASLLDALKQIANKKGITYQSYIKMILSEKIDRMRT